MEVDADEVNNRRRGIWLWSWTRDARLAEHPSCRRPRPQPLNTPDRTPSPTPIALNSRPHFLNVLTFVTTPAAPRMQLFHTLYPRHRYSRIGSFVLPPSCQAHEPRVSSDAQGRTYLGCSSSRHMLLAFVDLSVVQTSSPRCSDRLLGLRCYCLAALLVAGFEKVVHAGLRCLESGVASNYLTN